MAAENNFSPASEPPRTRVSLPARIFIGLVAGAILGGVASALAGENRQSIPRLRP